MDEIIHEMSRIYSMFCWPRGILNTATREITFENVWRNSDAEAYYNTLAEILKTQQAAQHAHEADHEQPQSWEVAPLGSWRLTLTVRHFEAQ